MRICDSCGDAHLRTNSPVCDRCRRKGTKKKGPIDGFGMLINAYARTCLDHRHLKTSSPTNCVECGVSISRGGIEVCKECQKTTYVLCACNCGKWRKKYGCTGLPHEYISGHNDSWADARRPEIQCASCRRSFRPSSPRQRLCSIECRTAWLAINPTREKKKFAVACIGCGEVIYRTPLQMKANKIGPACSHRCRAGVTGLANSQKVKQGKKVAKIRDEHACKVCGFSILAEVHHIVPKREGGSDDPSNLITLCPTHHEMADRGMIDRDCLFGLISRGVDREVQKQDQGTCGVALGSDRSMSSQLEDSP